MNPNATYISAADLYNMLHGYSSAPSQQSDAIGQWENIQPPSKTEIILSTIQHPNVTDMVQDKDGVWKPE